jgi:hypothetical protein
VGEEIKRIQKEGIRTDSYYIMDPYGDYLYVPTKFLADFNEENGGFSYSFNVTWENDNLSNKVTSTGNAKADEYAYIEMWLKMYNKYKSDPISEEKMATRIEELTPTETWQEIKNNNPDIYNILMNIQQSLTSTFASYGLYESDAEIEDKSLILYTYYRLGQDLFTKAKTDAQTINGDWRMNSDEIIRTFEEYKYTTLTSTLLLPTTGETQQLKLVVKVLNRTIDPSDVQIKDEDGNVYTDYVIENPFTQTQEDIPNIVTIDGTDYTVIWKNVNIRPAGNLSADKTIYGNIKNSSGQQVSMKLTVNKWAYTGMRYNSGTNTNGDPAHTNMNSNGYLNFYFNGYQEYSSEDYYQVVFNVYTASSEESTARFINFYPQDSRLLKNTTSDADMNEVKQRKDYIIYWDSSIKATVINNSSNAVSAVGNLSIGNGTVGQFNITALADTTVTGVVVQGKYFYEEMVINKIQLISMESGKYYEDVAPYLMAQSAETTLITDPTLTLPETGKVLINDGHVNYDHSDIKVRLVWNTSYESAINKLEGFVRHTYKDVATNEVNAKAKNILMNFNLTDTEKTQLIREATAYIKYRDGCEHLGTQCDECEAKAYQLLCLDEKYDYNGNETYLNGGINGNHLLTVVVQVGKSMSLYTTTVKVKMVFSDLTVKGNYHLTDPSGSELDPDNYTLYSAVPQNNLPETAYIAVRSSYWKEDTNKNSYLAENSISPYNTQDTYIYKLLDMYNEVNINRPHLDSSNLIKVTDIMYGNIQNGRVSSTSFKIDGVIYYSDLISFVVG